jgi:tetratricopeptide (TPR) repeat protein
MSKRKTTTRGTLATAGPRSTSGETARDTEPLFTASALTKPAFWLGALLVVVTVFAYAPVRHYGFVALDDQGYVMRNPQVRAGLTWAGMRWAFTTGYAANWHPLTWLSHMLDVQLFGLHAGAHHVVNLCLHLASTLLLWATLRRMTGSLGRSTFVAALFAVHPLHVESVVWIAERKDLLSTLFWMLTLWAYVSYVRAADRTSVRVWYGAVLLFFALGLLAKPMLVTLPFVLLLLDVWPLGRIAFPKTTPGVVSLALRAETTPGVVFGRLLVEKLPLFALAVASSVATLIAQRQGGAVVALHMVPLGVRVSNALVGYLTYLFRTIWPTRLAVFYPFDRSMPAWQGLAAFLALAALTVLLLRAARRRPYLGVGWLWFLGTLVPVIGLVQVGMQATADRYTYVPLIGIFIVIAWGAPELLARAPARRAVLPIAAAAAIAACTVGTRAQVAVWRDDQALWQHAKDVVPRNFRADSALGGMLNEAGKAHDAVALLREAVRIEPDFADAHNNLGMALVILGEDDEAAAELWTALRLNPGLGEAHNNLGTVLERQGKHAEALSQFTEALRLDPGSAEIRCRMGLTLVNQGKVSDAITLFQEALRLEPGFAEAHSDLGFALMALGRIDEAVSHYTEALRINPDLATAHENLGFVLAGAGKFEQAMPHFTTAVRLAPDSEQAHLYLAMALSSTHKGDEAVREYREVLRINPANEDARHQLDTLLKRGGR